jgi:hypothetical protein
MAGQLAEIGVGREFRITYCTGDSAQEGNPTVTLKPKREKRIHPAPCTRVE